VQNGQNAGSDTKVGSSGGAVEDVGDDDDVDEVVDAFIGVPVDVVEELVLAV
jgi:hypothetical protein